MWTLYCQSKATNQRPSEIVNVRQLDIELSGMESEWSGWWAGYQFDNAVLYFGSYIENKLTETDKEGKPTYRLEDFLEGDEKKRIDRSLENMQDVFASVTRKARRKD